MRPSKSVPFTLNGSSAQCHFSTFSKRHRHETDWQTDRWWCRPSA